MFSILRLDDADHSLWFDCFAFYARIFQESYPYREFRESSQSSQAISPLETFARGLKGFIILSDGKMLACCHYKVDRGKSMITSEVKFLQDSFHAPLAHYMRHALLQQCHSESIADLQMVVEHPLVLSHYLGSGQFRKVGSTFESVLDIQRLDAERLTSWLLPQPRYEVRRISWDDSAEAKASTSLYNVTNEDVPYQEAQGLVRHRKLDYFIERQARSKAQNRLWMAYGLFEGACLVGISIFECRMNAPKVLDIEFTGVERSRRGRGLGKGLKAATTLALMREIPSLRYIITGNEESNAPMLRINQCLGFVRRSEFSMLKLIRSAEA